MASVGKKRRFYTPQEVAVHNSREVGLALLAPCYCHFLGVTLVVYVPRTVGCLSLTAFWTCRSCWLLRTMVCLLAARAPVSTDDG